MRIGTINWDIFAKIESAKQKIIDKRILPKALDGLFSGVVFGSGKKIYAIGLGADYIEYIYGMAKKMPPLFGDFFDRELTDFSFSEMAVSRELMEYFLKGRRKFSAKPYPLWGTDFQRLVWAETEKIPYGKVISYGELAKKIGKPNSARAIGSALGKNPIPIIVPCHRVIGGDGDLCGFGGGIKLKKKLLEIEGVKL